MKNMKIKFAVMIWNTRGISCAFLINFFEWFWSALISGKFCSFIFQSLYFCLFRSSLSYFPRCSFSPFTARGGCSVVHFNNFLFLNAPLSVGYIFMLSATLFFFLLLLCVFRWQWNENNRRIIFFHPILFFVHSCCEIIFCIFGVVIFLSCYFWPLRKKNVFLLVFRFRIYVHILCIMQTIAGKWKKLREWAMKKKKENKIKNSSRNTLKIR